MPGVRPHGGTFSTPGDLWLILASNRSRRARNPPVAPAHLHLRWFPKMGLSAAWTSGHAGIPLALPRLSRRHNPRLPSYYASDFVPASARCPRVAPASARSAVVPRSHGSRPAWVLPPRLTTSATSSCHLQDFSEKQQYFVALRGLLSRRIRTVKPEPRPGRQVLRTPGRRSQ